MHRKRVLLGLMVGALVLLLAAVTIWWFGAGSAPQPSAESTTSFEAMLAEETLARWDGRVEFEGGELAVEKAGTDFPVQREYEQTVYLARFHVLGTDARFVVPFPPDAARDELTDWGMFSDDLPEQKVHALDGYSHLDDSLPIMIYGGEPASAEDPSTGLAWLITPAQLGSYWSMGTEVTMLERPDGSFELLP